jgi:hypothetical protein
MRETRWGRNRIWTNQGILALLLGLVLGLPSVLHAEDVTRRANGWDEKLKRPTRDLLRYTYGMPPLLPRLSEWSTATYDLSLLTASNDFVDAEQGSDKGVTLLRVSPDGRENRNTIPSFTDARGRAAKAWLTSIRE